MTMEPLERMVKQIRMNLQESNQKNHEDLQKKSESVLKKNSSEDNYSQMGARHNLEVRNSRVRSSVKCDKCQDTGWILIPQEHSQPLAITCDCRKVEKLRHEWKASGINTEMSKHKFSNFEIWNEASQRAKDTALAYYNDFYEVKDSRRNSILFCGQVGSGKTHLSVALAINFLERKTKVVYMPYRDVITKIKQNMIDAEYYTKILHKYKVCEILFIDDFFKGKINESDTNIMFEIINYRYLKFLPIIVSSEFSINKLLAFDEGVGSRIFEMCKDYVVEVEKDLHNNYRLK